MEPDILYVVRPGEQNEPLKLSLRSLAHLPHRRVFIAGYCPKWVRGVVAVPVRRRPNKFAAIEENVRQGLAHPDLSDNVVYMNDDFYFTRPVDAVPVTHGGLIEQYQGKQELKTRMQTTLRALQKHFPDRALYTYDGVHMPMPMNLAQARSALACIPRGCLWRTWYGNVANIGGETVPNAKAKGPLDELPTFLSTGYKGLQALRAQINEAVPERSHYVW